MPVASALMGNLEPAMANNSGAPLIVLAGPIVAALIRLSLQGPTCLAGRRAGDQNTIEWHDYSWNCSGCSRR